MSISRGIQLSTVSPHRWLEPVDLTSQPPVVTVKFLLLNSARTRVIAELPHGVEVWQRDESVERKVHQLVDVGLLVADVHAIVQQPHHLVVGAGVHRQVQGVANTFALGSSFWTFRKVKTFGKQLLNLPEHNSL